MAVFTQSIREILQQHMTTGQSLENISDVHDLASDYIFDNIPTGVISSEYIDNFITGFTLHFMNEELGYETLPLWKIALNEKIFNSGSYINKIYENLDKEVFADYRVKHAVNSGSTSDRKDVSGTVTTNREVDTSEESTDTLNVTESTENNSTDTYNGEDTSTITKSGSETHSKGGSDSLTKTGAESRHKSGTDSVAKIGSELITKGGSDTVTKTGKETTTNGGGDVTHRSTGSDNRTNTAQVTSDTPMGSLANLRSVVYDGSVEEDGSGDYYVDGYNAGASFELNNTYNYMSGAVESGQTSLNVESTNEETSTTRSSELSFTNREDETEYGSKQATSYGKNINGDADARRDETTYGANEDIVYGVRHDGAVSPRTDTTQYGSTDVVTYGKNGNSADERKDTTVTESDNTRGITATGSKESTNTDSATKSITTGDDTETTTSSNEVATGSHSDTENVTDYSMNWEMLYKSMPLLNKVWEIFDDLFMLIF